MVGPREERDESRSSIVPDEDHRTRQYLLARFWESALGFWRRDGARAAWPLTGLILAITLASIALQYRLNVWNRGMFDALDRRDAGGALHQALVFFLSLIHISEPTRLL